MTQRLDGGPALPYELVPLYDSDEKAQEVYDRWHVAKLEDLLQGMPELQTYTAGNGDQIRYADLMPGGDIIDEDHIIPLRLPIANGLRPHLFLRAKLMQELLDVPERIRIFPNDTKSQPTTDLRKYELKKIAYGNFRPLAELQQASIDNDVDIKSGVSNDNSGYSEGGVLALEQSLVGPTRSLDCVEIPTIKDRTDSPKSLDKDALNGGSPSLRPYNKAIFDSGIPALAEAFGAKRIRPTLKQMAVGGLQFILDTRLPINIAKKEGLTHATAAARLLLLSQINPEVAVVLANSAQGLIMPNRQTYEAYRPVRDVFTNSRLISMHGYGHEAGDNIWVPALLSREARRMAIAAQAA